MLRVFRARRRVAGVRQQRPPPTPPAPAPVPVPAPVPAPAPAAPAGDPAVDEYWRVHRCGGVGGGVEECVEDGREGGGEMVRRLVLRGTALRLTAALQRGDGAAAWEHILLTATCMPSEGEDEAGGRQGEKGEGEGEGEGEKGPPQSMPAAEVKVSRDRLLASEVYSRPAALAPPADTTTTSTSEEEVEILTLLTNMVPFLDLFFAEKKGIMILKFNGP
jgi:hypothetical protein